MVWPIAGCGGIRLAVLPRIRFGSSLFFGYRSWIVQLRGYVVEVDPYQALSERIDAIPIERYRNFSIVAHVDHGKSTLSDRLLELTRTIPEGSQGQFLDRLDVERERGITVKAQTCTMLYNYKGKDYLLHLVDTPGHVDFRAEVSRSYASCGGALLLVDASQGVQAQTVANFFLAYSLGLELIPIINKIDLDHADIARAREQIETMFELDPVGAIPVSAKRGTNVELILPAVIERIPPPSGNQNGPLRCLLVDSWFDTYQGVILLINVVDGVLRRGDKIISAHSRKRYEVKELGILHPDRKPMNHLRTGQVGYAVLGMKKITESVVGDTLMLVGQETEPLPGFVEPQPMVFVGAFPGEGLEFKVLEERVQQLVLNDRSVTLQRENSTALGQGWRIGFLGTLHASVFQDRLQKEYGASLIITAPTVPYKVVWNDGSEVIIRNPDEFPDPATMRTKVLDLQEPMVKAIMSFPQEYLGDIIEVCEANRGRQVDLIFLSKGNQVLLQYLIPTAHLVDDFFGKLKGVSKGYATLDYEDAGYESSDLVKMQLLVNGNSVDALSQVMHRSLTDRRGREWVKKFKQFLRAQLFETIIQAAVGAKIIARETIKARRKDVLARLHAADISRRQKLLKNQKAGKKHMQQVGKVHIPQDVCYKNLRISSSQLY
ncbi:P-loop containing nucleoside triphosphate hydrolase protein [Lipomyces oligophaga]|uniref:P-loop containing nucleoside triphosphate hydrolase protein n=1 Tax=Lipomyces oligophaga TaxID=45792 RepID=UPI0034CD3A1A